MYKKSSKKYEIITEQFHVEVLPKKTKLITFANPTNYLEICNSGQSFDYIFSDGVFLTFLYNRRFNRKVRRVSFDYGGIANTVFEQSTILGLSVAIIGATAEENATAVQKIKNRYPTLQITHAISGYKQFDDILDQLKSQPVDIIICGMGSPLQESFLMECKYKLSYNFTGFTCGGFITQTSLSDQYYTEFVNKYHLRWLVRFIRHKHVRQKLIFDYPKFLMKWITLA